MTGRIIDFKRPEPATEAPPEQHGSGPAFCLHCSHAWTAVVPTGVTAFQCPACRRHTGHFKFEFTPPQGSMVRVCDCSNQLFYLTSEGHMCASCGIYQRY